MKSRKALLVGGISLLLLSNGTFSASAESVSPSESSEPSVVSTEQLFYNGEDFELVTWEAEDGTLYYTIPTDVENKEEIAEYTDSLLNDQGTTEVADQVALRGTTLPWSRDFDTRDRDGRLQWAVSGFYESAYLYPITADRRVINDGILQTGYDGSGNPDKILLRYSYTFSGTSLTVSAPPSLSKTNNTVSWQSQPVQNTWYLSTKSIGAEATSRTLMFNTKINMEGEIYKGSYIYRPSISDSV